MGIKSSSGAGKGNRAATRAEYDLYRDTARAMGKQSMAAAAAICFEACQRVYDAFGFEDPDGRISRGVRWGGYRPGETIGLIQSKTGNVVSIPLVDGDGEDRVELYPELEEELGRATRGADDALIVRDERTGAGYTKDYMTKLHRRIREKAKLPADLKFTSFRHGGITEIGDSGTDDVRAVSGHSTLEVTRIYNKANQEKARRIAARRREHIAVIAAGSAEQDEEQEAA
jgi:integrase